MVIVLDDSISEGHDVDADLEEASGRMILGELLGERYLLVAGGAGGGDIGVSYRSS